MAAKRKPPPLPRAVLARPVPYEQHVEHEPLLRAGAAKVPRQMAPQKICDWQRRCGGRGRDTGQLPTVRRVEAACAQHLQPVSVQRGRGPKEHETAVERREGVGIDGDRDSPLVMKPLDEVAPGRGGPRRLVLGEWREFEVLRRAVAPARFKSGGEAVEDLPSVSTRLLHGSHSYRVARTMSAKRTRSYSVSASSCHLWRLMPCGSHVTVRRSTARGGRVTAMQQSGSRVAVV